MNFGLGNEDGSRQVREEDVTPGASFRDLDAQSNRTAAGAAPGTRSFTRACRGQI